MAEDKTPETKKPVTVIVRRTVKAGREADYEQWVKDTTEDLKKFPGYMDITMIRPSTGPNKSKEYVLIIRFDTYEHVDAWEKSDVRNKWMEKAKDFTEQLSNTKVTGLEYWFPLPEIPKSAVPPRYKMATVTGLALYPLSLIVNTIYTYLHLPVNLYLRGLIVTICMVSLMTYVVMPKMTSVFRNWLFPQKKD
jgi:uncharacterized protein